MMYREVDAASLGIGRMFFGKFLWLWKDENLSSVIAF